METTTFSKNYGVFATHSIHEQWVGIDIPRFIRGHRRGAGISKCVFAGMVRIQRRLIEGDDAVVDERARIHSAARALRRIVGYRAVVEGSIFNAPPVSRPVFSDEAIVVNAMSNSSSDTQRRIADYPATKRTGPNLARNLPIKLWFLRPRAPRPLRRPARFLPPAQARLVRPSSSPRRKAR